MALNNRVLALGLALGLAVVLLYAQGLGGPFCNCDEVIYAEFIRAMHDTGNYLELQYDGFVTLQRPPIPVTLYAVVAELVDGEAGMRLLPALLTALACLVAAISIWSLTRRLDAALVVLLLTAGCPSLFIYGRILSSDPPFVLATVCALFATMAAQTRPGWFLWALVCLGAAFALKSFAGAIPFVALCPWLLVAALRHRGDARLRLPLSLGGFVLVGSAYFVVSATMYGSRFYSDHIELNLLARARGEILGLGQGGAFFYIEHLWEADGALYSLILLGGVALGAIVAATSRKPTLGVASTYAAITLGALSALEFRTAHYLLPFYFGATACVGLLLAQYAPRLLGRRPHLWPLVPASVFVIVFVPLSAVVVTPEPAEPRHTVSLARTAERLTAPGEKVYSLDWYAPALGYYANRSWGLLTTSERGARIVAQIRVFEGAQTVVHGPPWPEGRLVVAGSPGDLERASALGLETLRVLDQSGPFILVEARGLRQSSPSSQF